MKEVFNNIARGFYLSVSGAVKFLFSVGWLISLVVILITLIRDYSQDVNTLFYWIPSGIILLSFLNFVGEEHKPVNWH